MCKKRRFYREITSFSVFNVVFALKNAFKSKKTLVLALAGLLLHNSMRLLVSQCFQCVKIDNVKKKRILSAK